MEEQYPIYHSVPNGYKVQTSAGSYLPGIFTKFTVAEQAYKKYLGKTNQAALNRKSRKK
jgi:hypothetical protein